MYCTSNVVRCLSVIGLTIFSFYIYLFIFQGAVVSPSDEDSQSFTIQGANNDCYKLKAANAKDRQSWVSRLRQEVERANSLASPGPKEALQVHVGTVHSYYYFSKAMMYMYMYIYMYIEFV